MISFSFLSRRRELKSASFREQIAPGILRDINLNGDSINLESCIIRSKCSLSLSLSLSFSHFSAKAIKVNPLHHAVAFIHFTSRLFIFAINAHPKLPIEFRRLRRGVFHSHSLFRRMDLISSSNLYGIQKLATRYTSMNPVARVN